MTDLDDGLDTSAPVWVSPKLTALWRETLPGIENSGNPDAPIYLDDQVTGDFKVGHSIDDGLPDPVTMSTSSDASGSAAVELIGRPGVEAVSMGWRTPRTYTGTLVAANTIVEFLSPTDAQFGDYVIVAFTIDKSSSTALTQWPGNNDHTWKLLSGPTVDGTTSLYVFGKQYWPGMSGLRVSFNSASVTYSTILCAAYARAVNSAIWVDWEPMRTTGAPEASVSAISVHTAPEVRMDRRGFAVSIWGLPSGSTAGPMAYGSTGAELTEITTGLRLMMAATGLVSPGTYTLQATTSGGTTNVMVMASLALELKERPFLDARQYFSPFNRNSPVYGFDRDTALTYLTQRTLTPAGVVDTALHSGQMADIEVDGREATMTAVSKTRLDLDKSLVLPVVTGDRENCSIDWLTTWVMARGGQYAGPAPSTMTRWWAPMYGSTHAHYESPYMYAGATFFEKGRTPSGPYGLRPPTAVQGPFMSGMFACQTAERTEEIFLSAIRLDMAREEGLPGPYGSTQPEDWQFNDQMSKANSAGRLTFWIRGDPAETYAGGASYLPSSNNDFLMRWHLYCQNSAGAFLGYVIITLSSADRYIRVRMGADHTGSTTITYNLAGQQIPSDGEWHFVGIKWNYATGQAEVNVDGSASGSNAYATNGDNDISLLSNTESDHVNSGGSFSNYFAAHLPVSDICYEAGSAAYSNNWTWHYPIPQGLNAVSRPTFQPLKAVVEAAPLQGWGLLSELAKATMSHFRANEEDSLEFLPPKYFGEPAQLVTSSVVDTEWNAGELDVTQDPSKVRNVITVKFPETRVDTNYRSILDITSAIEIPKGFSEMTFALDTLAGEIHGQSTPSSTVWDLMVLSAAMIADPTLIPNNVHFMTVNTSQDGTGTVLEYVSVFAQIYRATASTVTVRIWNKMGKSVWLTNNGDQVPFMRILGYGVSTADAYVTVRDSNSVKARRERSLDVETPWIHDRETATEFAGALAVALSRPRPEAVVQVMGDPRRRPGQLVEIADSQGTQAEGTWRVMNVDHKNAGGEYTQTLRLVRVLPLGDWDDPDLGWDQVNWAP